jgi:hypothetical protein
MLDSIPPLPLPPDFDPDANLIAQRTENGLFHESRKGSALAQQLVANGAPQDLELAKKVLEAVLRCQETRPDDPHVGNFYWMAEDQVVFDLNAVEFNLERLIPMMIQHGERLSVDMRQRVLEAIRLGLEEIQRLDVLVVYSNIALLDILNTCLGGELLGDGHTFQRGRQKLEAWMSLTAKNGTPFEFNSPTYTSVDLRALRLLADLVQDEETRLMARTAAIRLGVSIALHIHPQTGRWAGPHGRSYQPTIACETPPEIELLKRWVAEDALPEWLLAILEYRSGEMQVDETSYKPWKMTQTTFHSASFTLGTASREQTGQSNVLLAYYLRPGEEKPGVVYTRYLTNEKWLGDFYHSTDRTRSRNLIDEGRFWGVQQGNRAIGLYCPPQNLGVIHSAKAAILWTGRERVDEIWIGKQRIDSLPAAIPPGEVVVIGSGRAYTAVRVLNRTDLGRAAPLRLRQIQNDLVLEIYNYLGPEKPFWEMGWPGAFYQGKPQCGFYLEMAERSTYIHGGQFAQVVASGTLLDRVEQPFVYTGDQPRRWRVSYTREGQELGLEIDLMEWDLLRRWTQESELGFPMLESPLARQDDSGEIRLGEAILRWGDDERQPEPAWLLAIPQRRLWAAGYTGIQSVPLKLETPEGGVEIEAMACGTLVWRAGQVHLEAMGLQGVAPSIYKF